MASLLDQIKITRVSNAVSAGTSAINSSSVDMQGFENVLFLVAFGAITASGVQSINAAQSSDDADSDAFADLEGSKISVADDDDNQVVPLEIIKPRERYVRCEVARATQNSAIDGIIAIQWNGKKLPLTDDTTTVVSGESHLSPAEGTA